MLTETVVACRRSGSPECLVQSVIGVAFRNRRTWLLSPADSQVCTCVVDRTGVDQFGNPSRLQVLLCFVGSFLDAVFPQQDFEIFRLHFNSFRVERDVDLVYGELLSRWRHWSADGRHQERVLSMEHLWGGRFADQDLLTAKFETDAWHELMYAAPRQVALTQQQIEEAKLGYVPHPGLSPIWDDDVSNGIFQVEKQLRAERNVVERVV